MGESQQNDRNILIISPEPWDGHFVSKHHYAVVLAMQGCNVYFLDPPAADLSSPAIKQTQYKNLWSVSGPVVARGLRFYPAWLRRLTEAKWLQRLEAQIGKTFSTIWLFENSRFFDLGFAGRRTKIYHQVDLNQNFHVKQAALSADVCFCTTDYIKNEILPYNADVYKIHHAVADANEVMALTPEQVARYAPDRVNAAYVGNLKMAYLDVQLLAGTVKKFPQVLFHFVGTCRRDEPLYRALKDVKNVWWWGRVDSRQILPVLEQCDILLLTYQKAHYHDQASPHKVMEYLASGKVTVATYTDEYKDKPGLLEMVYEPEAYADKFGEVMSNLDHYNSNTTQNERKAFAKNNTYSKQLDRILTILNRHHLKF